MQLVINIYIIIILLLYAQHYICKWNASPRATDFYWTRSINLNLKDFILYLLTFTFNFYNIVLNKYKTVLVSFESMGNGAWSLFLALCCWDIPGSAQVTLCIANDWTQVANMEIIALNSMTLVQHMPFRWYETASKIGLKSDIRFFFFF